MTSNSVVVEWWPKVIVEEHSEMKVDRVKIRSKVFFILKKQFTWFKKDDILWIY